MCWVTTFVFSSCHFERGLAGVQIGCDEGTYLEYSSCDLQYIVYYILYKGKCEFHLKVSYPASSQFHAESGRGADGHPHLYALWFMP